MRGATLSALSTLSTLSILRPMARGFSLIEALVALLITAIGILGTVSLQGVVLGTTKTSNDNSIASLQVANLVTVMKGNQSYWLNVDSPFDIAIDLNSVITDNGASTEGQVLQGLSAQCTTDACNPQEAAAFQLKQWAQSTGESGFADRLPNASAQILRVATTDPAVFELRLQWSQKQVASGLDMSDLFHAGGSRTQGSYVVRVRP